MKRIVALAIALVLYANACVWAATCSITGSVQNIDATNCANCTITFTPAPQQPLTTGGTSYTSQPVSTTTDANGILTAISLPQGLIVTITISENGATFGGYTAIVPFLTTTTFVNMAQGVITSALNNLTVNNMQLFTSNGTFTVPAGVASFQLECWGGGAGGGGYGMSHVIGGNGGNTKVTHSGASVTDCEADGGTGGIDQAAGSPADGGNGGAAVTGILQIPGNFGWASTSPGNVDGAGVGGGGKGGAAVAGSDGSFGAGGPGGGPGGAGGNGAGGGGGGAYVRTMNTATTAGTQFAVTVGAAGTAGTGNTANGGAGHAGAVLFTW